MRTLETRPAQAGAITSEQDPEITVRPVTSGADWRRARALMLDLGVLSMAWPLVRQADSAA